MLPVNWFQPRSRDSSLAKMPNSGRISPLRTANFTQGGRNLGGRGGHATPARPQEPPTCQGWGLFQAIHARLFLPERPSSPVEGRPGRGRPDSGSHVGVGTPPAILAESRGMACLGLNSRASLRLLVTGKVVCSHKKLYPQSTTRRAAGTDLAGYGQHKCL